jgi:alpha-methylacyl-CoA racemase
MILPSADPPSADPPGPMLAGVRVLDLSAVGPASRAARWLADYGAEVVKVGAPGQPQPPWHAYGAGRGWRRITIDLKADAGRATFLRMAERADVVIESFRPGVVDRLGIGYAAVASRNRRVVYCSTTGYGQRGARSQWAGHDLGYLAVGGYLHSSGRDADGRPALPGTSVADAAGGGMHAVIAVLAALYARERHGLGAYLDVSVADGVLALMALAVDEHLASGAQPGPRASLLTGGYACYDVYRARDGRHLVVAALEARFWANLCRALDLPEWIDRQYDDEAQPEIRAALARVFGTRERDEWVALLAPRDTCVAPVLSVAEVAGDEQFAGRGVFISARPPDGAELRQVGPVLAGMRPTAGPSGLPGADQADAVLAAAGLAAPEIAELRRAGVVC